MFEPEQTLFTKPQVGGTLKIGRMIFLALAVLIDIGSLYLVLYPGNTKGEQFVRFGLSSLLLIGSMVLSAPVFPYVVWKLVKHERPIFWAIALITAAFPMLLMLIFGR
jgi:hypothetical protein